MGGPVTWERREWDDTEDSSCDVVEAGTNHQDTECCHGADKIKKVKHAQVNHTNDEAGGGRPSGRDHWD